MSRRVDSETAALRAQASAAARTAGADFDALWEVASPGAVAHRIFTPRRVAFLAAGSVAAVAAVVAVRRLRHHSA